MGKKRGQTGCQEVSFWPFEMILVPKCSQMLRGFENVSACNDDEALGRGTKKEGRKREEEKEKKNEKSQRQQHGGKGRSMHPPASHFQTASTPSEESASISDADIIPFQWPQSMDGPIIMC